MTSPRRSIGLTCYSQPALADRHRVILRTPELPKTEFGQDAEGAFVQPRKTLTLLEKLLMRADGKGWPATPKRGRGRPRKGGAA